MPFVIKDAAFVAGAESIASLPGIQLPEIALVGRSNVGKSSLLNRLTSRKGLARTSATPGRTQQINLFRLKLKTPKHGERELMLTDLPGFGFAKFSKEKRELLSELTVQYLLSREQLEAVCLLNDCRRLPEEDELSVRDLAFQAGTPLLVVVTKCDKLKPRELKEQLDAIASAYRLLPDDLVTTGEKMGNDAVWERLWLIVAGNRT